MTNIINCDRWRYYHFKSISYRVDSSVHLIDWTENSFKNYKSQIKLRFWRLSYPDPVWYNHHTTFKNGKEFLQVFDKCPKIEKRLAYDLRKKAQKLLKMAVTVILRIAMLLWRNRVLGLKSYQRGGWDIWVQRLVLTLMRVTPIWVRAVRMSVPLKGRKRI